MNARAAEQSGARREVVILWVFDSTEPGPATHHALSLLARLSRMQTVSAVCSIGPHGDHSEKLQSHGATAVSLETGNGPLSDLLAGARLTSVIDRHRPGVIVAIGPRARAVTGIAASMRRRVRTVAWWDSSVEESGGGLLSRISTRWAFDRVLIPDVDVLLDLRERSRHRHAHAVVLPRGVDVSARRSVPAVPADDLPTGFWYVGLPLSPGRSRIARGLIEAFRVFRGWRLDARLVVFGSPKKTGLAGCITDLGLDEHVVHVVPPPDRASLMRRMSAMWVHGEPRPDQGVILDSMCLGVPVICGHTTSLAPHIALQGGALMRDGQWPQQFAEATRGIAEDRGMAGAISAAGRALVDRNFRMLDHVTALRDLFDELVYGTARPLPSSPDHQSSTTALA